MLLLLLSASFALATLLQTRSARWSKTSSTDSILKILLGDSRRMFANHFFVKADISFHSGFYPSIFDQARRSEEAENAVAHEGEHGETHHEEKALPGEESTDWLDRFGRHFRVHSHTHLEGDTIREILPWLKLSAEMDPHRIETYTVAAFWLRSRLGKTSEAEQFLREGLRANPGSYEILYDLGRLYDEDRHDSAKARNLWHMAVRRWEESQAGQKDPDFQAYERITTHIAKLEEVQGNYAEAIRWLELAGTHSPANPGALKLQVESLRDQLKNSPAAAAHGNASH